MIYSYSSISTFTSCPRKFEGVYLERKWKDESTQITHGQKVHSELEAFFKGGPLPATAPPDGFAQLLRKIRAKAEVPLAMRADGTPCDFWDKAGRLRGKIDVLFASKKNVLMVDWKTGKRRDNSLQASVYSTLARATYNVPEIETIFDYLDKGRDAPIQETADDARHVISLMDAIDETKVFAPRPTPLCRWCAVKSCEYNK